MKFRTNRHHTRAVAGILHNGERATGHIVDYSADGMRLSTVLQAGLGDVLQIHCKGAVVNARVCWKRDNSVGVIFLKSGADSQQFHSLITALDRKAGKKVAPRLHGFSEL